MFCLLIELEFNLALGSDHKLVYLGSDEMFSFGDFGPWSQLVLAWNKKQTVSQGNIFISHTHICLDPK